MTIKINKDNAVVLKGYDRKDLILDGKWALDGEHNLKLGIRADSGTFLSGKTVIFRGTIENVKADSLTFRIREYENVLGVRSGTISLTGRWQADKNNRIVFEVSKKSGATDALIFEGEWHIGEDNTLTYKYETEYLRKGAKTTKVIIFRGNWDIRVGRLIYTIEGSNNSYFSFGVSLKRNSILASSGKLIFETGIKYDKKGFLNKTTKDIALYGKWVMTGDFKVGFEVVSTGFYGHKINFLAEKIIKRDNKIAVILSDIDGKNTGINLEFSKLFKNDAQFFLSLSKTSAETKILGGVTIKF